MAIKKNFMASEIKVNEKSDRIKEISKANKKYKTEESSFPKAKAVNMTDSHKGSIVNGIDNSKLIQGIILSEILGAPKARKRRGNNIWNSRF
jgi:hypothetical protein